MTLRVMNYNILDDGENREHLIAEVLNAVQPDIVIMQEVSRRQTLEFFAQNLKADCFFGNGNSNRHVGLISKFPITYRRSYYPFPLIWRNVVEAEIEYQPGKKFCVIGVHPMAMLGTAFEVWRWFEARYILSLANRHTGICLISGDFNAIAPGDRVEMNTMPGWLKAMIWVQGNRVNHFAMRQYLAAGYTDCFRLLNSEDSGFTLPPPHPNSRLDYILANPALKPYLRKCWVVREPEAVLKASDHYPVVAEFDL